MGVIWKSEGTHRSCVALFELAREMMPVSAMALAARANEIARADASHPLALTHLDTEIVRARLMRWRRDGLAKRLSRSSAREPWLFCVTKSKGLPAYSTDAARAQYERSRACYLALQQAGSASTHDLLALTGERWDAAHGLSAEAVSAMRMAARLHVWERKGFVRLQLGTDGYGTKRFEPVLEHYPTYDEAEARINAERNTKRAKKLGVVLPKSAKVMRAPVWVRGLMV